LQSNKEKIYNAAKAGDKALMELCLVGAMAEDFNFEKIDVVSRFLRDLLSDFPESLPRPSLLFCVTG
jgi:hypothetical protein